MPTFRYDKLVRDKIRQIHETNGDVVTGKTLSKSELIAGLLEKLEEERSELSDAIATNKIDDIESELADLYQVLEDIAATLAVSEDAIKAAKSKKFDKKGGFKKGQYIETVRIVHPHDPLIARFRTDPAKFPELQDEQP